MNSILLLVENDFDDEVLALHAPKRNYAMNEAIVARDKADAFDFIFGTGKRAGCDICEMSQLILLDLKILKIKGQKVLKRLSANRQIKLFPSVATTSSNKQQDLINKYSFGANNHIRKHADFTQRIEAVEQVGVYWLTPNQQPLKGGRQ
jgi:two-component system response regulator